MKLAWLVGIPTIVLIALFAVRSTPMLVNNPNGNSLPVHDRLFDQLPEQMPTPHLTPTVSPTPLSKRSSAGSICFAPDQPESGTATDYANPEQPKIFVTMGLRSISTPFQGMHGVVSPSGKLIAYSATYDGSPRGIHVAQVPTAVGQSLAHLDDRAVTNPTETQGRDFDGQPIWTADGSVIIFQRGSLAGKDNQKPDHTVDIYAVRTSDKSASLLAADIHVGAEIFTTLQLSPDERYLVYVAHSSMNVGKDGQLFLLSFSFREGISSGVPKNLMPSEGDFNPRWTNDGQWIIFTRPVASEKSNDHGSYSVYSTYADRAINIVTSQTVTFADACNHQTSPNG